jgi:ATP-dependent RNA helicase RhlE
LRFTDLNLIPPLLSALAAEGYENPTPIQAASIPPLLEGKDVLGCAQTGTGKTAAFALPLLQKLSARPVTGPRSVRALILSPTRELAVQIHESFQSYGRNLDLRSTTIFGGVGESPQKAALRRGVDIVIATPGRLLDLLGQRALTLDRLEHFVLDEADRMLDMGFVTDVRKICAYLPAKRQTLLFSATMPPEIRKLADSLLRNPVSVEVARVSSTAEKIDQGVYHIHREAKGTLLRAVLSDTALTRVLVFTRTKHGADRVCRTLERYSIPAEAIHGNKSQNARQRSLNRFKDGEARVLVATDLASRGIDVDGVSHVINYDIPADSETYVHRIGRTARAGASGISLSFCAPEDRPLLRDIEKLIRQSIRVLENPAMEEALAAVPSGPEPEERRGRPQQGRNGGSRGHQGGRSDRNDRGGRSEVRRDDSARRPEGRSQAPAHGDRSDERRMAPSDRSQPKIYLEGSRENGPRQGGDNRPRKFGKKPHRKGQNAKREYFSNGR